MKTVLIRLGVVAASLGFVAPTIGVAGMPMAKMSEAGIKYVVGGVGDDERKAMRTAYKHYKLRVEIAEKSGAYSADMQLKLSDGQGKVLVDVFVDGPWLLIDVPSGVYTLEVSKGDGRFSQQITLGNEAQQHVVFIWPKAE